MGILLVLLSVVSGSPPSVVSVEPARIVAYRPAQLTVTGNGFSSSCRVLIGPSGRLTPVHAEHVDEQTIRVDLRLGYGPTPRTRWLVVECPDRGRSRAFELTVVRSGEDPSSQSQRIGGPSGDLDDSGEASERPVVLALDPERAPGGEVFSLTLRGTGFCDGTRVRVLANSVAGTSQSPTYEMVEFEAEFVSPRVIVVDFDRGFAPSPGLRSVVAVNPEGAVSAPLYLEIGRGSR